MCFLHIITHKYMKAQPWNCPSSFVFRMEPELRRRYNKTKLNNSLLIREVSGLLAWHCSLVTVDYKVRMLAFSSSWQWGCSEGEARTRTSCYIKTNLRGKQCLRPPLKVLQVVRVSDIFKPRVMEAISFAQCEQSSAISSCLSDRQRGMYRDKCVLSAARRRRKKIENAKNVTDSIEYIAYNFPPFRLKSKGIFPVILVGFFSVCCTDYCNLVNQD